MNDKLSEVISKVKKLLALAGSTKSTHEANAAAAAADKLMQEYRISQAQLEAHGEVTNDPMDSHKIHSGGRRTAWREILLWSLSNHYGCTWYMHNARHEMWDTDKGRYVDKRTLDYTLVGRKSDCEITAYMFSWLTTTIENLAKIHTKGMGVGYAKAWFDGAARGVAHTFKQLKDAQEAEANSSTAMVLLGKRVEESVAHMNKLVPDLKNSKNIYGARDDAGRRDGFEEGKKIQIKQGLGEGSSPPTLKLKGKP